MDIFEESWDGLYPDKKIGFSYKIKYTGRLKGYNANIRYTRHFDSITISLGKAWHPVSRDIKMGIIQHLLNRAFKTNNRTLNIELYEHFLKNAHIALPKKIESSILKESFDRVNEHYFLGMIDLPSIRWGQPSKTKLGSYDFNTDTITISAIFKEKASDGKIQNFIDCVMFHEMLHKLHKFKRSGTKNIYHSQIFRQREQTFENAKHVESELKEFLHKQKRRSAWWF